MGTEQAIGTGCCLPPACSKKGSRCLGSCCCTQKAGACVWSHMLLCPGPACLQEEQLLRGRDSISRSGLNIASYGGRAQTAQQEGGYLQAVRDIK